MSTDSQPPEWWDQVIDPPLNSKADARCVVKQCREGEYKDAWKPQWKAFATCEGYIRLKDFERAQDIQMGISAPGPGRKGFHDWDLIDRLIDDAAKDMGSRVVRAEVCRRVAKQYNISPVSSSLRKRVTDRMKATGR